MRRPVIVMLTLALLVGCGGVGNGPGAGDSPSASTGEGGDTDDSASPTEGPSASVAPTGVANGTDAVITFTAGEKKPAAELELNGERQEASLGTHCWTSDSAGFCADYAGVSAPEDPLVLPEGTTLRVDGDAQSVEGVIGILIDQGGYGEVRSRQRLRFSSGEETIDVPPGEYVISLFTLWKQGDASMAFSIRVV